MFALDRPLLLVLLLPCLLPLRGAGAAWRGISSLALVPRDPASMAVDAALRALLALAMAATVLGLAGLHRPGTTVTRMGGGAHIVLVLDRSLSMDEPFAREGEVARETKTAAATRLIAEFFARRPHDEFGVVGFSTMPIQVMPLTAHRAAVAAALQAMGRKTLANTSIGGGLAYGLSLLAGDDPRATHVLLFVSDGAGIIPEATADYLRTESQRLHAHLYYLYLRAGDDPPLDEDLTGRNDQTRPAALDEYFRSLGVPYRGIEARDPAAVADAVARIGRLENRPVPYREEIKRRDAMGACYGASAFCLGLVLLAGLAERRIGARHLAGLAG